MLRDFFLGFIKIHVLHHAAQEPIYGVAMIAELARHGYNLSPGTLYPLLHSLEEQGYLVRSEQIVEGRVRKYYTITNKGRTALREAKEKIAELVHEVLKEEDDTPLPEVPSFSEEETEDC
jgi:PadR family transcriptional regulator, regulatory protein PadR